MTVALVLLAASYSVATSRLWQRTGVGRGVRPWEVIAAGTGWLTLVLALISPLDTMSDILFAAHMTQHELLMLIAAPLIVLGRPLVVLVWVLPKGGRHRIRRAQRPWVMSVWRHVTAPLTVLLLHAATVWAWHLPVLFDLALAHEGIHALQHAMFFGTAAMFWWALIHGRYGAVGYGVAVLFVFVTALHTSVLGALLTFAPRVLYSSYAHPAPALRIDPLEDQQLAGLLMWVPGGVLFVLVGLGLFAAWLGEGRRRDAVNQSGSSAARMRV